MNLAGRKAVITGASRGLGFSIAEVLGAQGSELYLSSSSEKIFEAGKILESKFPGRVHCAVVDLRDAGAVTAYAKEVVASAGGVDICAISTAHPPTHPFSSATDEHWIEGHRLLIDPVIRLTRAFLPEMRKRNFGRIIAIGSIFGVEPEVSSVVQSTYRTGLRAMMKCIATEEAPYGITANVICPGYFHTPLLEDLAEQYAQSCGSTVGEVLESWKTASPMQKFGNPQDLGELVAFLAGPHGSFITGTSIVADGGAIKEP